MMVYLSPQRHDDEIHYDFFEKQIVVSKNGVTKIIDVEKYVGKELTEDDLPLLSVEYKDDEYWVKLIYYHGPDAPEEVRYPEWKKVT